MQLWIHWWPLNLPLSLVLQGLELLLQGVTVTPQFLLREIVCEVREEVEGEAGWGWRRKAWRRLHLEEALKCREDF